MLTDDQLREKALEAVAAVKFGEPLRIAAVRNLRDLTRTDSRVLGIREATPFIDWAIAQRGPQSAASTLPPLDEPCATCDGDGTVPNPAFADLERRYGDAEKAYRTAGRTFWTASAECRDLDEEHQHITEMIDCRDCKGAGRTPTAAGGMLLAFLDRHHNLATVRSDLRALDRRVAATPNCGRCGDLGCAVCV